MTKQEFTDKLLQMKIHSKLFVIPVHEFHMMWKYRPVYVIRDLKRSSSILKHREFGTDQFKDKYIIYRKN